MSGVIEVEDDLLWGKGVDAQRNRHGEGGGVDDARKEKIRLRGIVKRFKHLTAFSRFEIRVVGVGNFSDLASFHEELQAFPREARIDLRLLGAHHREVLRDALQRGFVAEALVHVPSDRFR